MTDAATTGADATEKAFLDHLTARLAGLPGVQAVALGGSRAQGLARPDSDWDLSIYYRGTFDPQHLHDLGWPGEVSELGGWGGGVYNGGAWLRIDGRPVDVHYRDLDRVEQEIADNEQGRFWIEPLMFHLAGIPTYLITAELAINTTLYGSLPRPSYPAQLRQTAPPIWWDRAVPLFEYALRGHAVKGLRAQAIAMAVQAASCAAHAVLAARGEWITNEKRLLSSAGLSAIDRIVSDEPDPVALVTAVRQLCETALDHGH